jgi:hypothetical protein
VLECAITAWNGSGNAHELKKSAKLLFTAWENLYLLFSPSQAV